VTGKPAADTPTAETIDSFLREAAATSMVSYPSQFSGSPRYQSVRKLGEGGFGVVFEVIDLKQGGHLALKVLRQPYAERLRRFKHEFRALSDNAHSNLVRLYEMTAAGRDLFFTMELIDGVPLLEHVSRSPERARAAFKQLAEGLSALHAGKTLHRDIKPSNVMVDRRGRVVLLDFGLALDLDAGESSELAGTPLYMSPEQCAQQRLDAASDWYAVGTLLFEALTGRTPFDGTVRQLFDAKQGLDAPPPSRFASGVPEDLDQLCQALLRRDPGARPTGAEVLRRLDAAPVVRSELGARFFGRAAELAVLHARAATRGCRMVLAQGPSGIGKSALLRRFLDELKQQRPETVALAGRCYERESVPYKALDAVCDELARHLKRLPEVETAALLPRDAAALTRLFPVMRQVPLFQQQRGERLDGLEVSELRGRGVSALRELLTRLSDRRPVVVCIDDLQWGDVDSAALLADLVRGPDAPAIFWLASCREEETSTSPLLKKLAQLRQSALRDVEVHELALGPLDAPEARQLAAALLQEVSGDARRAETIATESGGSPFFVQELARRGGDGQQELGALVSLRTAALEGAARRILEVLAVAARPVKVECLAAAAAVGDELRDALSRLRAERLVRGRESESDQLIEIYHDRISVAVAAAIEPERLRMIHLALAAALEQHHGADAAEVGQHLADGGDAERAFGYLVRAAQAATTALAFDEAVRLYRRARELRPGGADVALELAFAEALSTTGHGVEAAHVWLAALDGVDDHRRLDLQRRAAEELLVSGHLDEGWAAMHSVMERLGLSAPRSTAGAVARVLWGRARRAMFKQPFRPAAQPIDERTQVRLDTVASLSWVAWMVNPILAAGLQAQYLPLALKSGDGGHAATALIIEALVSAGDGVKSQQRTQRLVDEARAVAIQVEIPAVWTLMSALEGTVALMEGRWPEALHKLDMAEQLSSEIGSWPRHSSLRMIVSTMRLNALFWLGRAGDVLRQIGPSIQGAEERGHLTGWLWLRMMESWALGFCDRVDEGVAAAAELRTRMPERGFELPRWYLEYLQVQFALERGDTDGAWQALLVARKKTRFALTSQPQRIFGVWLAAAAALARAARSDDRSVRQSMLGEARRGCARLENAGAPWATLIARGLRGGIASVEGDLERALRLLTEAEPLLASHDLELAAAAACHARGQLIGGDAGRALCERAATRVLPQGISRQAVWMHLPGTWQP
jgi:eukaryotic-like serine/threonine-protein kinase